MSSAPATATFTLGPRQATRSPWNRLWMQDGFNWKWQSIALFVAVVAVISRRPDAILNPQFYAEDGKFWYSDAYCIGWFISLFAPDGGYLNTVQRLAASLALLVPLHLAPLLMNCLGILIEALPVPLLLSSRSSHWGKLSVRALMAFSYLALPNTREIHVTITNSQFHLALIGFLIAFGGAPKSLPGKIAGSVTLAICGLSGPFSAVMTPLLAVLWYRRRYRWTVLTFTLMALCAGVQLVYLWGNISERPTSALGASVPFFLVLFAKQILVGSLMGKSVFVSGPDLPVALLISVFGLTFLVYALCRSSLELRLFIVFSYVLLAASLKHPLITSPISAWDALSHVDGMRYWFFPMLAFVWSLIWLANQDRSVLFKVASACLLLLGIDGIVNDWFHPVYTDQHFQYAARLFEQAGVGELGSIPLYPDGWVMDIPKKGPGCEHLPLGRMETSSVKPNDAGQLTVSGWVTGTQHIGRISILVDKTLRAAITPAIDRPDVNLRYPSSPDRSKGWSANVDVTGLAAGTHVLDIRALTADGCDAEFARASFPLLPPHNGKQ